MWLLDALDAAAGANAVNAASGCDGCGYWNTCGMRLLDAVEAAIGGNVVMLLFFAGSTGWLGFRLKQTPGPFLPLSLPGLSLCICETSWASCHQIVRKSLCALYPPHQSPNNGLGGPKNFTTAQLLNRVLFIYFFFSYWAKVIERTFS